MSDLFLKSDPSGISGSLLSGRLVLDGEPVTAGVTNRTPQANQANLSYVWEILKGLRDRSGEFLYGMPAAPGVLPGDFVYYDEAEHRFAAALAGFTVQNGECRELPSSAVWGVICRIHAGGADICTSGLCEFLTENPAYSEFPDSGPRFLSDRNPGEPVPYRTVPEKCLGVLVGVRESGEVQFFVRQSLFADSRVHEHKAFELVSAPAGTCSSSAPSQITGVLPDKPGWIPAGHPLLAGNAPAGAFYGYNPAFLNETCRWPLPFASRAGLRWQRHITASDDPLTASVPPEFWSMDETTIWWHTNTPDYLPWDSGADYAAGEAVSGIGAPYPYRMWLEYVNAGYGMTTDAAVTSLRVKKGSGLSLSQYPFGGEALRGDLLLDFALAFQTTEPLSWSGTAVKHLDGTSLAEGPVVSGLKIDSSRWRILQSENVSQDGFHYGRLVLSDSTGQTGQELPFEAVHLNGAEEALEREAIGLAFPPSRPSSLIARVCVPYNASQGDYRLRFSFGILLPRPSGTVASGVLKLSYRKISAPSVINTQIPAFPEPDLIPLACNFSSGIGTGSPGYYTAESASFSVSAGDLVFVRIERTPPDNFNDRILLLRKAGILSPA
jgi:hypothetical protein